MFRKDVRMQYDDVKELIEIFEKTDLNDMELTLDNMSIRLSRGASAAGGGTMPAYGVSHSEMIHQSPVPASTVRKDDSEIDSRSDKDSSNKEGTAVKAPIVGTFYASSSPDKPAFIKVGDTIAEGDPLCIIEAMKFMNEVPSKIGGTVAEILVKDGEFVEFGQELFRIV